MYTIQVRRIDAISQKGLFSICLNAMKLKYGKFYKLPKIIILLFSVFQLMPSLSLDFGIESPVRYIARGSIL